MRWVLMCFTTYICITIKGSTESLSYVTKLDCGGSILERNMREINDDKYSQRNAKLNHVMCMHNNDKTIMTCRIEKG